ncbi:MAG: hypothetical protein QHJ74_08850 [Anaerolineae bacterium]|jgi:hypothetical protein|nr:hypothetical protein [Anaerolineae bacterium]
MITSKRAFVKGTVTPPLWVRFSFGAGLSRSGQPLLRPEPGEGLRPERRVAALSIARPTAPSTAKAHSRDRGCAVRNRAYHILEG